MPGVPSSRSRSGSARLFTLAAVAVCASWVSAATPQVPADVNALMDRVGERVADYFRRAQSLICTERSTVQPIGRDWGLQGFSRTVESELRVDSVDSDGQMLAEPTVVRTVRRVNGREPKERDKRDRAGCTDPSPFSRAPLSFLLPANHGQYRFTAVKRGREGSREALIVDFMSVNRTSKLELIKDQQGHDDCFDWTGPLATKGRIWVDATTHDVLRVDRGLPGPVELRVPTALQQRYSFPSWIVLDRDSQTMRYRSVAFTNPDEVVMLPASVESTTIVRSSLQSARSTQTFTDYRRFLTGARIVRSP
jgi:hypothetical protein